MSGDAEVFDRIGFVLGAPLALAFARWIAERVGESGDMPLFCSRDGWILQRVYERLRVVRPSLPPSRYLLISRRAVSLAAVGSLDDEMARYLMHRQSPAAVTGQATLPDDPLFCSAEESRERWATLRADERAVLEDAAAARAGFVTYADAVGLFSAQSVTLVDLGWNGSQQLALSEIARLAERDTRVKALYLGLYPTARRLTHFGLDADAMLVTPESPEADQRWLQGGVPLIEALFSAPHGSVYAYDETGRPVVHHAAFEQTQWADVAVFQRALLRGVEALLEDGAPDVRADDAREALAHLAFHPTADAAECCGALRHADGVNRATAGAPIADMTSIADLSPQELDSRFAAAHWKWGFLSRLATRLDELPAETRGRANHLLVSGALASHWPWDSAIARIVEEAARRGVQHAYVYGAGDFGVRLQRAARAAGLGVVGFIDSSRSMHGLDVDGLLVYPLAYARTHGPHVYLVGSFAWAAQIAGVVYAEYAGTTTPTVLTHRSEQLER